MAVRGDWTPNEVMKADDLNDTFAAKADEQTAWQDFTPSWNNVTVGNGTVAARYTQIGKIVHGYVMFTLGGTSTVAAGAGIDVPLTASANIIDRSAVGQSIYFDSGTQAYFGFVAYRTGAPDYLQFYYPSGNPPSSGDLTPTLPFTWTTSDRIQVTFQYEAA